MIFLFKSRASAFGQDAQGVPCHFLQMILANAGKSLRLKITLLFLAALLHFFVQIENVVNLRADYICK